MTFRKAISDYFNDVRRPRPERALLSLTRREKLSYDDTNKAIELICSVKNLEDRIYGGRGENLTLLVWAAQNNYTRIAEALLARGAMVDGEAGIGMTPLMWAVAGGYLGLAETLISKGARLDATDESNSTPLAWAIECGRFDPDYPVVDMVQLLTDKGIGLEAKDQFGQTPLMKAAARRWKTAASVLIDNGASVEAQDDRGRTALMLAAWGGHENTALLLIEKGANVNRQDAMGDTPLSFAAKQGHDDLVKLLMEKGANLDTAVEGAKKRGWANPAVEKLEAFRRQLAETTAAAPETRTAPAAQAKPPVPK
jgi:ankyrin repeat protein